MTTKAKRRTVREIADAGVRAVLQKTQGHNPPEGWMVYEHERIMWLAGYRAGIRAGKRKRTT